MRTITINLELTEIQAAALRGTLQIVHRQRMQDEFWCDRYRYIPHKMRAGHIVASCPDMAAGVKLTTYVTVRHTDAGKAVEAVFEAITSSLKSGDEVRLVGFGTFAVTQRKASTGRNPRTGETMTIEASNQPKFKAGKALKDAVN